MIKLAGRVRVIKGLFNNYSLEWTRLKHGFVPEDVLIQGIKHVHVVHVLLRFAGFDDVGDSIQVLQTIERLIFANRLIRLPEFFRSEGFRHLVGIADEHDLVTAMLDDVNAAVHRQLPVLFDL